MIINYVNTRVVQVKNINGNKVHTFFNQEAYYSDSFYKRWIDENLYNFEKVYKDEDGNIIYLVS